MSYQSWIDRYVTEVSRQLRGKGQPDLIAELRSTLEDELHGLAAGKDREPTEADVHAVLRRFGSPAEVAAQYVAPRSLIGPALFPDYVSTLGYLLALTLGLCFVVLLLSADGVSLYGAFETLLSVAVWTTVITTAVYAGIEAAGGGDAPAAADWEPGQLPELETVSLRAESGHVVSNLITDGFFLLWWSGAISIAGWFGLWSHVSITPTALWSPYYWPLLTLVGISFLMHACVLWRGYWQRWSLIVSLSVNLALLAIGLLLLNAGDLVQVGGTDAEFALHTIQRSAWCSLLIVLGFVAWEVVWSARRLFARDVIKPADLAVAS